jgi:uncharacterized protein (DUF885 family)
MASNSSSEWTQSDLAAFNDALVKSTGVPLTVLPTVIDRYIAGAEKA